MQLQTFLLAQKEVLKLDATFSSTYSRRRVFELKKKKRVKSTNKNDDDDEHLKCTLFIIAVAGRRDRKSERSRGSRRDLFVQESTDDARNSHTFFGIRSTSKCCSNERAALDPEDTHSMWMKKRVSGGWRSRNSRPNGQVQDRSSRANNTQHTKAHSQLFSRAREHRWRSWNSLKPECGKKEQKLKTDKQYKRRQRRQENKLKKLWFVVQVYTFYFILFFSSPLSVSHFALPWTSPVHIEPAATLSTTSRMILFLTAEKKNRSPTFSSYLL